MGSWREWRALWFCHLVLLGQIDPQLEAPQITLCHLGHLAVNDTTPSGHPLHSSILNHSL